MCCALLRATRPIQGEEGRYGDEIRSEKQKVTTKGGIFSLSKIHFLFHHPQQHPKKGVFFPLKIKESPSFDFFFFVLLYTFSRWENC